jgi:hypothetical protein
MDQQDDTGVLLPVPEHPGNISSKPKVAEFQHWNNRVARSSIGLTHEDCSMGDQFST